MAWHCPWKQGGKQEALLEKHSIEQPPSVSLWMEGMLPPECSPKATRTSQDSGEQAPGAILLETEAKQDPQL